jgi:hypothetical protein
MAGVMALLTSRVQRGDRVVYGERWTPVTVLGEPRERVALEVRPHGSEVRHRYQLVEVLAAGERESREVCVTRLCPEWHASRAGAR